MISRSTPNYCFDAATTGKPAVKPEAKDATVPTLDESALDFVKQATSDSENPIVLFALEALLVTHQISMKDMPKDFEPASLLPGWLHKR